MGPWGRVPPPARGGKWVTGWRHSPPQTGDVEQVCEDRLAAWLWLRGELSWQLDDHYTPEMFRAAQTCCSMSADYIQRTELRVGDTIYFLEPYGD